MGAVMRFLLLALLFAASPAAAQPDCKGNLTAQDNLAGVCSKADARDNLELGSVAQQDADAVAITGGTATGLTSLGMTSTGAFYGASGTTAQRPTATAGGFRFNSTTGLPEYADGASWTSFGTGGTVTSVEAGAGMDFTTITGTGSVAASANTRTSGVSVPICPAGVGCATTGAPDLYPIPFAGKVAANVTPLVACRASPAGTVTVVIKKWTTGNPATSSTICTTSISTSCAVTQCTSGETSLSAGDSLSIEGTTASADASAVIGVTVPIVRD